MVRSVDVEVLGVCKRFNIALTESKYADYSLRKLAPLFQRTHGTIRRWQYAEARPSFDAAVIICNVLDISFEWLLTGQGVMVKAHYTLDERALIEIFRHLSYERQREYITFGYLQMSRADIISQCKSHRQALLNLVSRDQK